MRSFCAKIALFGLVQVFILGALLTQYDVSRESNYLAQTVEKHRWLHQAKSPKLVLVGGSNVPFGIQAPRIEEAIAMPVVNMGLAAGLGLDFMLNEITGSLNSGDAVLLSVEYDRFSGGFDPGIVQQVLQFRPSSLRFLEFKHFRRVVLDRGLRVLGGIVRRSVDSLIERDFKEMAGDRPHRGFNRWGDMTFHYGQAGTIYGDDATDAARSRHITGYLRNEAVETLREFVEKCSARGVVVMYSFPPHPFPTLKRNVDAVEEVATALKSVRQLILLDTPMEHGYSPGMFYDTGYHLTEEGAGERTVKIITSLRRAMGKGTNAVEGPGELKE